ncbi:hypothetical protein PLICRDRAFT_37476 [Plicaturopsis crispa FD-325 SS-3]|nr:hypothetical protein PLICRDRAFT_37476 [Plicaturopsis crispa FD-325 SS-3]
MKSILAYTDKDPLARSTLASAIIPDSQNISVLDMLTRSAAVGTVSKEVAKPLSHILVTLARSDTLFATLRHSNASAMQLDKGKRKRDEPGDEWHQHGEERPAKRPFYPQYDLHMQITEAVRAITHTLSTTRMTGDRMLDSSVISSIQMPLHQVFLFAVTSSARGGPEMNVLQEISGLIQVIGVLSGIQIASAPGFQPPNIPPSTPIYPPHPADPWPQAVSNQITDIGTAVYPCLVSSCPKTFSRLYSLRSHQRMHALHRPYRCTTCPASFARNHDLKRHAKLHDKTAWKCRGCEKMFSRRDAIKRHKNSARTRGERGVVCVASEILEVELHTEEKEEAVKEGRRVKMWNGLAAIQSEMGGALGYPGESGTSNVHGGGEVGIEEGEINPEIISEAQMAVVSLHGLLQAHVTGVLGAPAAQSSSQQPHIDLTGGQATLASVIARAQVQNLPFGSSQPQQSDPPPAQSSDPSILFEAPDGHPPEASPTPALSLYGLSDEQTKMLEEAIASAAAAAQSQAEAEAAMEEEDESYDDLDEEPFESEEGDDAAEGAGGS